MEPKSAALVDILLKQNYVSKEQIDSVLKEKPDADIVKELLLAKILTKDLIGQAISEFYKVSYFDLSNKDIPKENLDVIAKELGEQYKLIFVAEDKSRVHFTTAVPEKIEFLKESLSKYFPKKRIDITYSLDEDIADLFKKTELPFTDKFKQMISVEGFAISEIFTEIVEEALKEKASDIHFEPLPEQVQLRIRMDGKLQDLVSIKKEICACNPSYAR